MDHWSDPPWRFLCSARANGKMPTKSSLSMDIIGGLTYGKHRIPKRCCLDPGSQHITHGQGNLCHLVSYLQMTWGFASSWTEFRKWWCSSYLYPMLKIKGLCHTFLRAIFCFPVRKCCIQNGTQLDVLKDLRIIHWFWNYLFISRLKIKLARVNAY